MSGTVIKHCGCQHEFQDKQYGRGMRVHNYAEKTEAYRCTVCCALKTKEKKKVEEKKDEKEEKKKGRK